jgi:2-polyprenyl-6-methoxyphenol hydroxylase-like FAD-dependent oxidoreductase
MQRIGEHAVVVGASMAGLLAARTLSEAYEQVTVLDRDALPDGFDGRRAVPQGRHAHALLPRGLACMDELLPGFGAELIADGAETAAALEEKRFVTAATRSRARRPAGGRSSPDGRSSRAMSDGACARCPASSCASAATSSG